MGDDRLNSAGEAADTERDRGEVEGLERVAVSGNGIDDDANRYQRKQVTSDDAGGGADSSYCVTTWLDGETNGVMGRGGSCFQPFDDDNALVRVANAPNIRGLDKNTHRSSCFDGRIVAREYDITQGTILDHEIGDESIGVEWDDDWDIHGYGDRNIRFSTLERAEVEQNDGNLQRKEEVGASAEQVRDENTSPLYVFCLPRVSAVVNAEWTENRASLGEIDGLTGNGDTACVVDTDFDEKNFKFQCLLKNVMSLIPEEREEQLFEEL